jgi:hypothetical protein
VRGRLREIEGVAEVGDQGENELAAKVSSLPLPTRFSVMLAQKKWKKTQGKEETKMEVAGQVDVVTSSPK